MVRNSVKSSRKASMGKAFVGVTRLRMAVDNAAWENISQGLRVIAELNL